MKPLSNILEYYTGYLVTKLALGWSTSEVIGLAVLIVTMSIICIRLIFAKSKFLASKKEMLSVFSFGLLGFYLILSN